MSYIIKAVKRAAACLVAFSLSLSVAACGAETSGNTHQSTPDSTSSTVTADALHKAHIAVFVPSDGITISQHTALNKWAKFTPALTKELEKTGVPSSAVDIKTSADLTKQSDDVQDYVVKQLASGSSTKTHNTTIILSPALSTGDNEYGDYVTRPQAESTDTTTKKADATQAANKARTRLVQSLKLARKSGAHIVLMAQPIQGFTPDLYVQMSTPFDIGALEARQLADKLAVDKATVNHPKSVEVMIPQTAAAASDSDSSTGATATGQSKSTELKTQGSVDEGQSAAFAKEAFAGIWSVLEPYFKDGRLVSPSGRLDNRTTNHDWRSVTFTATKSQDASDELGKRLVPQDAEGRDLQPRHVDGIIAMNDFASHGIIDKLTSLKYEGSSADVNPDISISGIIGTITGHRNLERQAVPEPAQQSGTDRHPSSGKETGNHPSSSLTGVDMSWPVVTGYGAYVDMLPDIVNGKQWMTGMEDLQGIAQNIAEANVSLLAGKASGELSHTKNRKMDGNNVPVLTAHLMAVSASNLKQAIIDPGYATMADAGL